MKFDSIFLKFDSSLNQIEKYSFLLIETLDKSINIPIPKTRRESKTIHIHINDYLKLELSLHKPYDLLKELFDQKHITFDQAILIKTIILQLSDPIKNLIKFSHDVKYETETINAFKQAYGLLQNCYLDKNNPKFDAFNECIKGIDKIIDSQMASAFSKANYDTSNYDE